ncbi:MAG: ABC transporter substrate-binding protein, partial [Zhenhengia sp.]
LTDFSAGNEPDVIQFFTDVNSKTLVEQNKVVSIEEIRSEYPDYASNINPAAMDSAKCYDGKQYAVPTHGYYEGIFCNKDLFEANGIELPTDWAKLEAAITGFAEKGITPIAAALGHIPHYWIEHLILAEGCVQDHSNRDVVVVVKYKMVYHNLGNLMIWHSQQMQQQHNMNLFKLNLLIMKQLCS